MDQNRRRFVMSTGATALAFAGVARGANRRVNVAFIGVGNRGVRNLVCVSKMAGAEVVAVCDIDPSA
jgi:predicted homoserine dehydrogenase-like protein